MVFWQSSGTLNLFQSAFSDGRGESISQLIAVRFSVQVITHLPTTQKSANFSNFKRKSKEIDAYAGTLDAIRTRGLPLRSGLNTLLISDG